MRRVFVFVLLLLMVGEVRAACPDGETIEAAPTTDKRVEIVKSCHNSSSNLNERKEVSPTKYDKHPLVGPCFRDDTGRLNCKYRWGPIDP